MGKKIQFFTDAHLQAVARWLRFFGYNTLVGKSTVRNHPYKKIRKERRIYLTTSEEGFALGVKKGVPSVLLPRSYPLEQVRYLLKTLNLSPSLRFDRCPLCNSVLYPQSTEEKKFLCPRCKKEYWEGSHIERIRVKYEDLLKTLKELGRR
jgi:hypothetical protein